jgi:hypothetical protein
MIGKDGDNALLSVLVAGIIALIALSVYGVVSAIKYLF